MTIAANQRGSRLLEESSTKIGVEKYSYWYFCHDTTRGCMNSQKVNDRIQVSLIGITRSMGRMQDLSEAEGEPSVPC